MKTSIVDSRRVVDALGASLFNHGELGRAHVLAHRALDADEIRNGHFALREFLGARSGTGSCWVHLQWHQLVFELELGRLSCALDLYHREVKPAIEMGLAATDGPSALWRLHLAAPGFPLDWSPAHSIAVRRLAAGGDEPFVQFHHLLALAGAGDARRLERFISLQGDGTLGRCAWMLLAFVQRQWSDVVSGLDMLLSDDRPVGGSRAQNALLRQIRDFAAVRPRLLAA